MMMLIMIQKKIVIMMIKVRQDAINGFNIYLKWKEENFDDLGALIMFRKLRGSNYSKKKVF